MQAKLHHVAKKEGPGPQIAEFAKIYAITASKSIVKSKGNVGSFKNR